MKVGTEWDKVRYCLSDFHGNQVWPRCKQAKEQYPVVRIHLGALSKLVKNNKCTEYIM